MYAYPIKLGFHTIHFGNCCSRAVVLNQGDFCARGDIWQCLKTFFAFTSRGGGPTGI